MAAPRINAVPVPLYCLPSRAGHATPEPKDDCVVALRALGEDTRVRIIGLLIAEPLDVGEVARRVGVSHYNASKHLKILKEAGLLTLEKNGRRHLYALADGIRRQARDGDVLDLGCCSFNFDRPAPAVRKPARSR